MTRDSKIFISKLSRRTIWYPQFVDPLETECEELVAKYQNTAWVKVPSTWAQG
jgi:hypothetical protein